MVNIENELFSEVAGILREQFKGIKVYSEYVNSPSSFPCVTFMEQDNYTNIESLPLSNIEAASNLMYEINVYSNKKNGKKQECKDIMSVIDGIMLNKGFVRIMLNPIQNINDDTIYRIVSRYRKIQV